jgi:hypothetical protein
VGVGIGTSVATTKYNLMDNSNRNINIIKKNGAIAVGRCLLDRETHQKDRQTW